MKKRLNDGCSTTIHTRRRAGLVGISRCTIGCRWASFTSKRCQLRCKSVRIDEPWNSLARCSSIVAMISGVMKNLDKMMKIQKNHMTHGRWLKLGCLFMHDRNSPHVYIHIHMYQYPYTCLHGLFMHVFYQSSCIHTHDTCMQR